jgi:formate-dependent nitrite reductase membrane component NrfD
VQKDARVVLDAGHRVEWGWPVGLYLLTKGIAAGAAILSPFVGALHLRGGPLAYGPEIIALLFTLITCGLLVEDLKKPWAFYRMLTRPNFKSWLVKGGIILTAFIVTVCLTILARLAGMDGVANGLRWVNALIGLGVAGYTAFLFAQCNGRDLWESKQWLLPHLLIQAVMCGAVVFLAFNPHSWPLRIIAIVSLLLHVALALREKYGHHHTDNATQGAAFLDVIRLGPLNCWRDGLLIGSAIAILVILFVPLIGWIPALLSLFLYEYTFVRSGQLPPLS